METPYTMFGAVKEAMLLLPMALSSAISFIASPPVVASVMVTLM